MNAENINGFWNNFNELCISIKECYIKVSKSENYQEISLLKEIISNGQELISISAPILPMYDIKRSQQVVT